jgi:glycosyltransferase involved in cell wall biosynthesis
MPKVSIVIPCYNLGMFVGEAVASVKSQSYTDWELILVNDGSTDDITAEILLEIARKNPDFRLIDQVNKGLSAARNVGIEKAAGEFIVCLDADDKLASEYLEKTVPVLDKDTNSKVAVVTTWLREFGLREDLWKTSDYDVAQLLITNVLHAGSLFRKVAWKEVGGYKPAMKGGYEDWELWLSMVEKGYTWTIVPAPLFLYRIREGSMLSGSGQIHDDLYTRIYGLHTKLFEQHTRDLALTNANEIKKLRTLLAASEQVQGESVHVIRENNELIADLRHQTASLRQQLSDLRDSRIIKKALQVRGVARLARLRAGNAKRTTQASARRAAQLARSTVGPLVPTKIRRALKGAYARRKQARIQTVIAHNVAWAAERPLVSVVVAYYNREDTIDETINSLKAQTFANFEIVIVDDGSTDQKSAKKFDDLKAGGLKATFLRQSNQGPAAARNTGIARAEGKYIICLDSDDMLDPTFIEKVVIVLETQPDIALVTTHVDRFGVDNQIEIRNEYDPTHQLDDNRVIPAAAFKRHAWVEAGGYKSGLGYEDWEFWITLSEHGYWGKLLPEPLFRYRTAAESRYLKDKDQHFINVQRIKELHPQYRTLIRLLLAKRRHNVSIIDPQTAFINLDDGSEYWTAADGRPNVLMVLPWMTFGGAETLICNFCNELKAKFNISFVTGLKSEHEWEYRFKEISTSIYHLANLFDSEQLYLEFISNYIRTRNIKIMHIVHTGFVFGILEQIKDRHPDLKIIVTMFNDRADHFAQSVTASNYIDLFSTDNQQVVTRYNQELGEGRTVVRIPNGINCYDAFNPKLFSRAEERRSLGVSDDSLAVFFIGRLSEEKNPDVFLETARSLKKSGKLDKCRFYVIGDGVMRPTVEIMIKEIGSENVTYLGYKPNAEIAKYLAAADIFILPSAIEGFPLSILEAMAMKVVVVASRVGAVPDIVEDGRNGFVVSPGSVPEIAGVIEKLIDDPKLVASVKAVAREDIEGKYSNLILGKNYIMLYDTARNLSSGS